VSKRRGRRSSRHYTRVGQQKPLPERLVEIEAALIRHGFLAGEADGVWDDASIEALKRFQERHDIKPTGKLSSLSLIALGLGPQRAPFQAAALPGTVNAAPQQPLAADGEGSPRDNE
jgi:hypothetical protein